MDAQATPKVAQRWYSADPGGGNRDELAHGQLLLTSEALIAEKPKDDKKGGHGDEDLY